MKTIVLLSAFAICFFKSDVQGQPAIQWQKSYGGAGVDYGKDVQQTPDGGFIVAGKTSARDLPGIHGRSDILVSKTDTAGNLQWQKLLGGAQDDEANSIAVTKDGGYILAGTTHSNDGDITYNHLANDVWIVKLNKSGDIQWQKTYGGKGDDKGNFIIQTKDGGYIIAGATSSEDGDPGTIKRTGFDCWIIKINSTGGIEWQKTYSGKSNDYATAIRQTRDGGYIMAGYLTLGGNEAPQGKGHADFWIIKLTSNGVTQWQKVYGGTDNDVPRDIQETTDGGYIIAGSTSSKNGDVINKRGGWEDCWIVKINGTGEMDWQKTLGGSTDEIAYSVQPVKDGYVFGCTTTSKDGDVTGLKGGKDGWIVKLDKKGELVWQKTLGGSYNDETFAVKVSADGAMFICGYSTSNNGDIISRIGTADMLLIKLK